MSLEDDLEQRILDRIARGELGVVALAKTEAPARVRQILEIAKDREDKQCLAANRYLVELAGIQPPTPKVVETPERILDQMTAEELTRFAEQKIIPDRFLDAFARVASAALEKVAPPCDDDEPA